MRLVVLLCLFAAPALADGGLAAIPVYGQIVAVSVPAGYAPAQEFEKDGTYVLQLAPQGQTVESWTQLITLTGARGRASGAAAVATATELAKAYNAACPTSFSARSLPLPQIKGATEVFAGFLGCGDNRGQSQAMIFVVMKGAQDIYTLQWAEHGPVSATPIEPDPAVWRPRADQLALTRLCDPVAGEPAPYPSCTR